LAIVTRAVMRVLPAAGVRTSAHSSTTPFNFRIIQPRSHRAVKFRSCRAAARAAATSGREKIW
jgi:hypothetical protein